MNVSPAVLIAALALALGGCGSGCNVPPPPQSDICELPANAPRPTVSAVEIGQKQGGVFTPIVADSVVELVIGGQGSDMVVAALRITGAGLGSCTAQETILEQADGDLITSEQAALVTVPAGPGAVVTGDILLPYYGVYGALVRVRAEVSGTTAAVEFWAGSRDDVDAAIDARPDARPDAAPVDAVLSDAMAADAAPDA